jgi:hypothetical protein
MKTGYLYFLRTGIVAAAAALAACSSTGGSRGDEGAVVEARALERWNLLIAHQAEKAYDYLSPGFRQTVTREKYAEQKNDVAIRWKAAHVNGHHCDGDSCTVTVMIDTRVQMPGLGKAAPATLPSEERWVKVDRSWYYLPDNRMKAVPVQPVREGQPANQAGATPASPEPAKASN